MPGTVELQFLGIQKAYFRVAQGSETTLHTNKGWVTVEGAEEGLHLTTAQSSLDMEYGYPDRQTRRFIADMPLGLVGFVVRADEIRVPFILKDGGGKKIVEVVELADAGNENGGLQIPAEELRELRAREQAIHITG